MLQLVHIFIFMFLKAYRFKHLYYDSTESKAVSADELKREFKETSTETVATTSLKTF